jgi:hypothetical protein
MISAPEEATECLEIVKERMKIATECTERQRAVKKEKTKLEQLVRNTLEVAAELKLPLMLTGNSMQAPLLPQTAAIL